MSCETFAEIIQGSDFKQSFVIKKNKVVQDITGITAAVVKLQNTDGTVATFSIAASNISVLGNPLQGTLQLFITAAASALLKICDRKNLDITITGPWGILTYRAVSAIQVSELAL